MKMFPVVMAFALTAFMACNSNAPKSKSDVQATGEESEVSTFTDLTASTDIKELLCQNWENKEDAEDVAASGGGGSMEVPYRGFSFFKDETVTENPRDNIRFGKWKLDDKSKIIELEFTKGSKARYKIGAIGPRQMILLNMADNKKTEYRADAQAQMVPEQDPFHPSNNQWRIKPLRSETDSAIKKRTKEAVLFYAKFLQDNGGRGGSVISFVGLPSCFKWYKGGVSVTGVNKLEDRWINCFYNKEQAIKSQQMLEKIISKKYKWNKDESNWVKQSADVVRQMHDTLNRF